MGKFKKILLGVLMISVMLFICSCKNGNSPNSVVESSSSKADISSSNEESSSADISSSSTVSSSSEESSESSSSSEDKSTSENSSSTEGSSISDSSSSSSEKTIDENGSYTKKEDVALYIHTYGKLPKNFITKKEAEKLGWTGGSLEKYAKGMCIGGDRFGNYEELLPSKSGRKYTECDIDTLGKSSRGAKRIVFSNDGLVYYTDDHYETFTLLYGEEG